MTVFKNIISTLIVAGIFALHPSLNNENSAFATLQHFFYENSQIIFTEKPIDKKGTKLKIASKNPVNSFKKLLFIKKRGSDLKNLSSINQNHLTTHVRINKYEYIYSQSGPCPTADSERWARTGGAVELEESRTKLLV